MICLRHVATAFLLGSLAGCVGASGSTTSGAAKSAAQSEAEAESVSARVIALIVREMGVPQERVTLQARFVEDLGVDELDMIMLVMELEVEFGIEFTDEDVARLVTVGDAIEFVRSAAQK